MRFYYVFINAIWSFLAIFPLVFLFQRVFYAKKRKLGHKLPRAHLYAAYVFCFALGGIFSATGVPTIQDLHFYPNINFEFYLNFRGNFQQYFLNILLFVPVGFFLPLLWKRFRNFFLCSGVGFLFSLAIEGAQIFNYRVTDIEDLVMNTLGTIIGYLFYFIMVKLIPIKADKFALGKKCFCTKELLGYISLCWLGIIFIVPFIAEWGWGLIYG